MPLKLLCLDKKEIDGLHRHAERDRQLPLTFNLPNNTIMII